MATELSRKERDILKMVKSNCHLGSRNYSINMERFFHSITNKGIPIFDLEQTYQKIKLAALVIAGMPDISEVMVISSRTAGQRPVVKFSTFTGCSVTSSSRWTPGCLTNHLTKQFKEPRLILVADPYADSKPVLEASYMNIPCIALCNSGTNLKNVDICIPVNTSTTESISMVMWLLTREVLMLKGELRLESNDDWEIMVDLFYHKDAKPEEVEDEEDAEVAKEEEEEGNDWEENNN